MAVITLSRSFGSGGAEIAHLVCNSIGYHYFDKWLMARVASFAGLTKEELYDFSEDEHKVDGFLEQLIKWRSPRVVARRNNLKEDDANGVRVEVEELDEVRAIGMVKATIEAAYHHRNVMIVGRGGQRILQDKPNVLHIRVVASLSQRVARVQARYDLDEKSAKELVLQRDLATRDYLKRFYDIDINDALPYHMVLNTSKYSIESLAYIIAREIGYVAPNTKVHAV